MISKPSLFLGLVLTASTLAAPTFAQAPTPPRTSPTTRVEQSVGMSKITLSYSRPGAKGREIFGGLVPWGEVWRTGANEATLFELSHDAQVNGQKLAAGKYALFTIPKQDNWSVIFNRQAEQWGSGNYKSEEDALRLEIAPQKISAQERFEIRVVDVDETTAKVEIRWAEVMVPFTVVFDTNTLAIEQAKAFVAKATKDDARAVSTWANWSLQSGVALTEAESWIAKVAAENDLYRYHALHARLLAKNGKTKEAGAAADKALARAAGADAQLPGVAADADKLKAERATWK